MKYMSVRFRRGWLIPEEIVIPVAGHSEVNRQQEVSRGI